MSVTVTYDPAWRAAYWDADIPAREAWFVTCPEHPWVGKDSEGEPWGYSTSGAAQGVRTRHLKVDHAGESQ